ncbi:hypothetical protein Y032_0030g2162 [Ancylostoma ceylanicum]|uniref:Uncharacterized protein n=1 Tax=Ancylostoma ceylanicum TaxID=53326 RepID=A0A016URQ6_9BILA|nr:hypothetical protein Y032_0030g2162 [Ancylostoma ceylanicum]
MLFVYLFIFAVRFNTLNLFEVAITLYSVYGTLQAVPLFAASIPGVERPAADCEKPETFPEGRSKSFVKKINDRRRLMVQGKQKNGRLGSYLPVGENVLEMVGCLVSLLVLVTLFLNCSRIIPKATQLIQ